MHVSWKENLFVENGIIPNVGKLCKSIAYPMCPLEPCPADYPVQLSNKLMRSAPVDTGAYAEALVI